jgi:hypothetical protein
MIEIIALAAALLLVPALTAFAWIAKKRIDELQDEVFALTDEVQELKHRVNYWEGCAIGGRLVPFDGVLAEPTALAILRKAGEE